MAVKYFPKLSQTHVRIDIGGGESRNVPMLPVERLQELKDCSAALIAAETNEAVEAVRGRMIALARTVLPPELSGNLERFQVDKLSELLAYLMYGDSAGDDQPVDEPAKKN